jgi:Tol biopolymer transport system component
MRNENLQYSFFGRNEAMWRWMSRILVAGWFVGMVLVAVRGMPAQGQGNDGGAVKQYFPSLMRYAPARVNPPFRDYLAVGMSDGDGDAEIYTIRGDGSDLRKLTSNEWIDTEAGFSPDGSLIAFIRRDAIGDSTARPMVMNRDGSNLRPLVEDLTGNQVNMYWSPNSQQLLVSFRRSDPVPEVQLLLVAFDGTVTELYSASSESLGFIFGWSPDGRYIYYVPHYGTDMSSLWVMPTTGGTAQPLISSYIYSLNWHPDSSELLVLVVEDDDVLRGRLLSPDGNTNRIVFEGYYRFVEWVQNGKLMLLNGLVDSRLFTMPRHGGSITPLTKSGVRVGGVDVTGTGVLYMSDTITDSIVYWNTFDADGPRELMTGEKVVALQPGTPSLAQDGSGLVFSLYDSSDRLGNTYLYYANLREADSTEIGELFSYYPIRFLPFSSQRAVAQTGTGGYPPPRYAMPYMVDIQHETVERLLFPDDLFLVYEWRYLP